MKYFNDYLDYTMKIVETDLEILEAEGDSEAVSNYLYFMRDKINAKIKVERKAQKAKEQARAERLASYRS